MLLFPSSLRKTVWCFDGSQSSTRLAARRQAANQRLAHSPARPTTNHGAACTPAPAHHHCHPAGTPNIHHTVHSCSVHPCTNQPTTSTHDNIFITIIVTNEEVNNILSSSVCLCASVDCTKVFFEGAYSIYGNLFAKKIHEAGRRPTRDTTIE